jgi:hypothetical protein
MKNMLRNLACAWAGIWAFLIPLPLKAGFDGPYSLTPPSPGVYSGPQVSTNYGAWSVWRGESKVNTSNAPAGLTLEVPAYSLFANWIRFVIRAAASGTVSFDCTTVSTYPGLISWVRESGGARPTYSHLDTDPGGVPKHFEFPVQAGDLFGFCLNSGGCVVVNDEVWTHTLTVGNFFAPAPPLLTMQSPAILRWQGVSNQTYIVETCTNLVSTNWVIAGTVTSTGTDCCFTNSNISEAQRFYRVTLP